MKEILFNRPVSQVVNTFIVLAICMIAVMPVSAFAARAFFTFSAREANAGELPASVSSDEVLPEVGSSDEVLPEVGSSDEVLPEAVPGSGNQKAVKVELKYVDGKYSLYRDGKPYYIKGAGIEFGNIANLASHGANSMRTWRTDSARPELDKARENGLTVMMGLEVGRERQGFDYDDTARVRQQFEFLKGEVLKYKDHPALLAWGIGNELNLWYKNKKVWDAVNDIAKMIHEVDGNHPTTTMLSGIGKDEIDYIKEHCPDLDFISIQMYGDVINIKKRISDAGWDGAYAVTEWGATGHWEVPRTQWNIPIEQTSSEKADVILERWEKAIYANKTHCLGSYVFFWAQKQERTPTWYGFFLETGEETEPTDVMQYVWTGKWPENRCPRMDSIFLDGKTRYDNIHLKSGQDYVLNVYSHDYDNDSLTLEIQIMPDIPEYYRGGGDHEQRPLTINKNEYDKYESGQIIKAPAEKGPYRVFIYVRDGHNNAGTANVPFYVDK
jgi:hypothetical protein